MDIFTCLQFYKCVFFWGVLSFRVFPLDLALHVWNVIDISHLLPGDKTCSEIFSQAHGRINAIARDLALVGSVCSYAARNHHNMHHLWSIVRPWWNHFLEWNLLKHQKVFDVCSNLPLLSHLFRTKPATCILCSSWTDKASQSGRSYENCTSYFLRHKYKFPVSGWHNLLR